MPLVYAAATSTHPLRSATGLRRCAPASLDRVVYEAVTSALAQGVDALEHTITTLVTHGGRADESRVLPSIVGALSSDEGLAQLLGLLLTDEAALAAIQRHSYYHHNGFRKLVLLQNASFKLRLHLWEARREQHHENIHDHRWNFASCLLAGSFQTVIWEEASDGPATRLDCTYTPGGEDGAYGVRENGLVQLRPQATHTLRAGDLYYLPASTLHQVTDPGQGHTRSLMLTAAPLLASCKLYAERAIPDQDKANVPFSQAAIRQELEALLSATHSLVLAA
jgi:hypothetical protein